jgi:uncharacterized protein
VTICPQCKSRVSDVPPPLKPVGGGGLGVNEVVRPKLKELRTVLRAHKASNPRVFGPVARGSPRKDSDLDLLVDFQAGASVFDWGALSEDLTELFGRHVDVGTDASLWPSIRSQVLSEAVAVWCIGTEEGSLTFALVPRLHKHPTTKRAVVAF